MTFFFRCVFFYSKLVDVVTQLSATVCHGVETCQVVSARAFVYHQPMDGREKEVVYFPSALVSKSHIEIQSHTFASICCERCIT